MARNPGGQEGATIIGGQELCTGAFVSEVWHQTPLVGGYAAITGCQEPGISVLLSTAWHCYPVFRRLALLCLSRGPGSNIYPCRKSLPVSGRRAVVTRRRLSAPWHDGAWHTCPGSRGCHGTGITVRSVNYRLSGIGTRNCLSEGPDVSPPHGTSASCSCGD